MQRPRTQPPLPRCRTVALSNPPRGSVPSTLLKAIADRETTIKRLEAELRKEEEKPSSKKLPDLPSWVGEQLKDLAGLLKSDPAKVKSEFRRLNLQLTFHPTETEPRPHYIVKGQCDLGALVFFYLRSRRQSAVLGSLRVHRGQVNRARRRRRLRLDCVATQRVAALCNGNLTNH